MPKICALYSRVSTDIQRDKGLSIPRQKSWLEEESARHNLGNIRHYVDSGFSAANPNRPALTQLLEDIESSQVKTVICYRYDRIARDVRWLLTFLDKLKTYDVDFISLQERFDSTSPIGKAMLTIVGTFAQLERETTVERVRGAMFEMTKQGKFCGGQPAYGLEIKNKKLRINKREAMIVRQMFDRFEELKSFRGITVWLNKEGYLTKRKTTFASSTIKRILQNPIYKGYQTFGKRPGAGKFIPKDKWLVTRANVESIISEKQFDRVQRIIQSRNFALPQRTGIIYLLSGLFHCHCGATMVGMTYRKITRKNPRAYSYYKCNGRIAKGNCLQGKFNKEEIERLVLEYVKRKANLFFNKAETEIAITKLRAASPVSLQQRLQRVETGLKSIEKKEARLLTLFENSAINKGLLEKRINELKGQKVTLQVEKDKLTLEINPKTKTKRVDVLQKINDLNGELFQLPEITKREILRQLVKSIYLKKDGHLFIELFEL
jgi:site-specific DNA recombinase